uniref:B- and T-lymphocyte attenuator-like isoform X2 n=1 Tax=Oncorhynchus gorbuscha TaxID=8017 RepID=UPI001EAE9413|nr:B- and T-lymphocyte attenuator-like isoform X2 [Oncorhynchus gorbuscha]
MYRPRSDHILLVLCLLFLLCVHGNAQDQGPTCEVRVKRNTIWNAVPQKALTINCPVRHCGEKLHATWCRFVDLLNCEQIHETEQVTFGWRQKYILILNFKKISINDDGLYRCGVAENGSTTVSHAIKVSVSVCVSLFLPPLHLTAELSGTVAVCAAKPSITGTRRPGDHTACAGPSSPLGYCKNVYHGKLIFFPEKLHWSLKTFIKYLANTTCHWNTGVMVADNGPL